MGSRWKGSIEPGSMPALHRYFGTPVTTWILNRLYSSHFSDIHCGMRGITTDALERMNLQSQSWEYASEMVLKSVHMELRTAEVPVRFLKDREGRLSHHKREGWFSPFKAAWINLRAMFVYGADFFLVKPGLVLRSLGLLLTLPADASATSTRAVRALALLAVPRPRRARRRLPDASSSGASPRCSSTTRAQQPRDGVSVFPYTRTVADRRRARGCSASRLAIPLVVTYLDERLRARRRPTAIQNHLAVTGLALRSSAARSCSPSRCCCTARSSRRPAAGRRVDARDSGTTDSRPRRARPRSASIATPTPGRSLRRLAQRRRRAPPRRLRRTPASATSAAGSTRASPARSSTGAAARTLVDVALAEDLKRHPKVTAHRRVAARRAPHHRDRLARRHAVPLGARAPLGPGGRAARAAARHRARAASCCVNVPSWLGKRALELSAFRLGPEPGRGDGRPQVVLRPARPLAAARPRRLPAERDPLPPPQVRAEHVRRVPGRRTDRRSDLVADFTPHLPRRDASRSSSARPRRRRPRRRRAGRGPRRAAGACSSSVSAARPATPSHAVNDFRKICGFEAYAPTDNVCELTARTNDEGWETVVRRAGSRSRASAPTTRCSSSRSAAATPSATSRPTSSARSSSPGRSARSVYGIVGRDGGHTATVADAVVVIPPLYADRITPHTEGCARSSGTCSCRIPRCSGRRPSGSRSRPRRAP